MWQIKGLPNRIDGEVFTMETPFIFIEAAKASQAKWQNLAYASFESKRASDCTLCQATLRYNVTVGAKLGCNNCPVAYITGEKRGCYGSPWQTWTLQVSRTKAEEAAEEEFLFLEGIHSIFTHWLHYSEYCE